MRITIIPTVFATSLDEFDKRLNLLLKLSNNLQIDIMDGMFVPATTTPLNEIPSFNGFGHFLEAHLMVRDPISYIDNLAQKGFTKVIFHIESVSSKTEALDVIQAIRDHGMDPMIAINPSTSLNTILGLFPPMQSILFLGHEPGSEGGGFESEVETKIRNFHFHHPDVSIQVDGGVNLDSIQRLVREGVTRFNVGSFISNSNDPQMKLEELESAVANL